MTDGLELPLRSETSTQADGSDVPLTAQGSGDFKASVNTQTEGWFDRPGQMLLDVVASVGFWYVMLFVSLTDPQLYIFAGALLVCMIAWRLWRLRMAPTTGLEAQVPYTTGVAVEGGKELLLVATLHISPRAPEDVEKVVTATTPDVVMIELDEERLDRMRHEEVAKVSEPAEEALQLIHIKDGKDDGYRAIHAQRALWNGEYAGQRITGQVVYDAANSHGLATPQQDLRGKLLLVHRGGNNGEFAPFALKAFKAAEAGATAVLVVNSSGPLPCNRVGGASFLSDLRLSLMTRSCGYPPVPLLLLPHDEGTRLCDALKNGGTGPTSLEFQVMTDDYPRRGLGKRLCQGCALLFTGIGVLYGIIQCFAVEVGGEFTAAEMIARAKNIPCVCVDVNLDSFWSRLGWDVLPTPVNIGKSLLAWLAFPRIVFRIFFPSQDSVDIPGSMVLHALSFPLRTWVAFLLAGFCASFVTTHILDFFCSGAEQAAEGAGVVHTKSQEEKDDVSAWIMLAMEMYAFPRIYDAVAASRDEAMYRSIVEKGRAQGARRMVVVAGAGHANGILQRVRTRGL